MPSPLMSSPRLDPNSIIFEDLGLHLGVIGSLLDLGLLTPDDIAEELQLLLDDIETEEAEEEYNDARTIAEERIEAALVLLHQFALNREDVAQIEYLSFDSGSEIYRLIEDLVDVDTGGEEDYYLVADLMSLEALSSLKEVNLSGYATDVDIVPLEEHPNELFGIETIPGAGVSLGVLD